MDKQDLHHKAWSLLEEKGLGLGEMVMVRSCFVEWGSYKEEYPFINIKYNKGEIEYYRSEYVDIENFLFKTEEEVILANAIYKNIKNFNSNEFPQLLKFTFRLLNMDSVWAE